MDGDEYRCALGGANQIHSTPGDLSLPYCTNAGTGGVALPVDTDDNFARATVSFAVASATTASVVATFDDSHQASFVLNLISGSFTPA